VDDLHKILEILAFSTFNFPLTRAIFPCFKRLLPSPEQAHTLHERKLFGFQERLRSTGRSLFYFALVTLMGLGKTEMTDHLWAWIKNAWHGGFVGMILLDP